MGIDPEKSTRKGADVFYFRQLIHPLIEDTEYIGAEWFILLIAISFDPPLFFQL